MTTTIQQLFRKNISQFVIAVVAVSFLFVPAACRNHKDRLREAIMIGEPQGVVADNLYTTFSYTEPQEVPDRPVFVGDVDNIDWNDSLVDFLKKGFDRGYPVVLVNPSVDEVVRVSVLLGLDDYDNMSDFESAGRFDFYAFVLNKKEILSTLIVQNQPYEQDIQTVTETYRDNALVSTDTGVEKVFDTENNQDARVEILLDWISEEYFQWDYDSYAAQRDDAIELLAEKADLDPIKLTSEYANVYSFRGTYGHAPGTEKHAHLNSNTYEIKYTVWGVYCPDLGKDFILVSQEAGLNAAGQIHNDDKTKLGYYAKTYEIDAYIDGYKSDATGDINVSSTSIKIEPGVKTVSESHGWKLDLKASVKYTQKEGWEGGAEVGGGVEHVDSYSYNVADVTRKDISRSFTNVGLIHEFVSPAHDYDSANWKIVDLAKSSYSPRVIWLWQIDSELRQKHPRGVPIKTDFAAVLEETEVWRFLWNAYNVRSWRFPASHTYYFSWPLMPPYDDLKFEQGALAPAEDFRWMDLSGFQNLDGVKFTNDRIRQIGMIGCSLTKCSLKGAVFDGIDMYDSVLAGSDLSGASFKKANLQYVNLQNAILDNADLEGADLQNATLQYLTARSANLNGANLKGAKILKTRFDGSSFEGATWTDGKACGKAGTKDACPR